LSSANSELIFSGGGRSRPLTVHRSANARAMRLSVDPRDGTVRLSLPTRAAIRPALAWAEEKRAWIEGALAVLPAPRPIVPGATIPFEDRAILIAWRPDAPRTVVLREDSLHVGGPEASVGPRVLRWLRREAGERMAAETHGSRRRDDRQDRHRRSPIALGQLRVIGGYTL
jgi:predicted metal-dependent hydrolase